MDANGVCINGSDVLYKTEWDYSMPDINITSIWTLSSTGCSCSFSDRCPFSLMPYYSTAWGSSVFMFKCDFPSSFGEVLLTQQKLCDIRWWERGIKKMLHMFWIHRCLLVRMGASWYWFCDTGFVSKCIFPVFQSVTHFDTEICLGEGKTMKDNN